MTILAGACLPGLGCGSSPSAPGGLGSSAPAGPLSFTVAPIDPALIQYIVPLGEMGPWGHTLPTDHIYFYHHLGAAGFAAVPLVAPAAGTVEGMISPNGDGEVKLTVRVNGTFTYYFDHLTPAPGIVVGSRLEAGSPVGTSAGIALDFHVSNQSLHLGLINPARYGGASGETMRTDAPLKYFTEPIRSQLYARVRRDGAEQDGRIDYDVAGTLSGNWFAEDLPPAMSQGGGFNVGSKQLAFARDAWHPDRQRVSLGGLGMTGLYGVPSDAPEFSAVTPSAGLVVYPLLNTGEPGGPSGNVRLGSLLVQMLDGQRLRVEAVPDSRAATGAFSVAAQIYLR